MQCLSLKNWGYRSNVDHGEPNQTIDKSRVIYKLTLNETGIYILGIFCPKWKTGKNLKEDLKKGKEKAGKKRKKKRVIKHTSEYLYEA